MPQAQHFFYFTSLLNGWPVRQDVTEQMTQKTEVQLNFNNTCVHVVLKIVRGICTHKDDWSEDDEGG
jgi:hypothetical protein